MDFAEPIDNFYERLGILSRRYKQSLRKISASLGFGETYINSFKSKGIPLPQTALVLLEEKSGFNNSFLFSGVGKHFASNSKGAELKRIYGDAEGEVLGVLDGTPGNDESDVPESARLGQLLQSLGKTMEEQARVVKKSSDRVGEIERRVARIESAVEEIARIVIKPKNPLKLAAGKIPKKGDDEKQ